MGSNMAIDADMAMGSNMAIDSHMAIGSNLIMGSTQTTGAPPAPAAAFQSNSGILLPAPFFRERIGSPGPRLVVAWGGV